jgi:hypothetical protein
MHRVMFTQFFPQVAKETTLSSMNEQDLQAARSERIETLRRDILPTRREWALRIKAFLEGPQDGELTPELAELLYFQNEYEVVQNKKMTKDVRQKFNAARSKYLLRYHILKSGGVLRSSLTAEEVARGTSVCNEYADWISALESCERDMEIWFNRAHPKQQQHLSLYTKWDHEVERRELLKTSGVSDVARKMRNVSRGICSNESCDMFEEAELVKTSESGLVCPCCGFIQDFGGAGAGGSIDNSIESISYEDRGAYFTQHDRSGAYERTENFMKNLDKLEAAAIITSKVPLEVKQHVRDYICRGLKVANANITITLIRKVLKNAELHQWYPDAPIIWEFTTGETIEKSTSEQRTIIRDMHLKYSKAFDECPPEILGTRKSSLTNNYLSCKIYQMLGLTHRIRYIHMLKGDKKVREHDHIFQWIVEHVRRTSDLKNVEIGRSYWKWFPTPSVVDYCD